MEIVISFILGGCFGIATITIIFANAYSNLADELIAERENNKGLAEVIDEIRKEAKEDGRK